MKKSLTEGEDCHDGNDSSDGERELDRIEDHLEYDMEETGVKLSFYGSSETLEVLTLELAAECEDGAEADADEGGEDGGDGQ